MILNSYFKHQKNHGNVVINFGHNPLNDFNAFATGYHRAGQLLANQMRQANGYPDYDGYPIFFLYRHALELRLKAIVYHGSQLSKLITNEEIFNKNIFRNHCLSKLLPSVTLIFDILKLEFKKDTAGALSWQDFNELVAIVDAIDTNSFTFRYPIDNKGNPSTPNYFVINVLTVAESLDILLDRLDDIVTWIQHEWDGIAETRYSQQMMNEIKIF